MSNLAWKDDRIGHHIMSVLRDEHGRPYITINVRPDGKFGAGINGKGYHVLEGATTLGEAKAVAIMLLRLN